MNAPVKSFHAASQDLSDRHWNEIVLLGTLLSFAGKEELSVVKAIMGPEHFTEVSHARLFVLIDEAADKGLKLFPLAQHVIMALAHDYQAVGETITANRVVSGCMANAGPLIGLEGYARSIKHEWLRDELAKASAADDAAECERIASEMRDLATAHKTQDGLEHVGSAVDSVLSHLNDVFMSGVIDSGAYPGSIELENLLGGFKPGRFYVIAGRPGMGKSTTALSLLRQSASKGHGVAIFSLEMTRQELIEIALCDTAWSRSNRVEYRDIQAGSAHKPGFREKFEAVLDVRERVESLPLVITDRAGLSIDDIRRESLKARQHLEARGRKLEVVCIDHLNLIKPAGRYAGNKTAETEEISGQLKVLAKDLGVAVVCLVQLNRGVEGREDKMPSLADLRWSGAIEQDADLVMFVYREAYYLAKPKESPDEDADRLIRLAQVKNDLTLVVAKNRGGPTPALKMFCDIGCGVVRDAEK